MDLQFIFDWLYTLATQAETWLISTTGFGIAAVISLLWNNRTQLKILATNTILDGMKGQLVKYESTNAELTSKLDLEVKRVQELLKAMKVLNDNIYILTQSANIGVENKVLIAKNYTSITDVVPVVSSVVRTLDTTVSTVNQELEKLNEQSSLDDLLKKVE
jgi:hypothetical protein